MRWLLIFLVITLEIHRLLITSTSAALQEHNNMEEAANEKMQITAVSRRAIGGRGGFGGARGGFYGGSSGLKGGGSGVKGGRSGSGRARGYGTIGGAGILGAGTAGAAARASHHRNHSNHGSASPTVPFTFTLLSSLLTLGIFLVNS